MTKLSIIIPLYNLENYIGKCIASTLRQDLPSEEYEVLVVDDGSTDRSYAAACRAAEGHPNVRVFTKPNEGLGPTRNYGTDRAAGRYVLYLDADDYLESDRLGTVVAAMERDALDMLCFRLRGVDEHGSEVPIPAWERIYSGLEAGIGPGKRFLQESRFIPMVWAWAYDRKFLDRHSLRMEPIWHEDEEFTPRALYHARRVRFLECCVYNYLQRSDSFMGAYRPEDFYHNVPAMQNLRNFAQRIEREGDAEGARILRLHIGRTVYQICLHAIRSGNCRELIRRLRRAGVFPLTFERRRFRYTLLNRSPRLFILYCRLHRRKR